MFCTNCGERLEDDVLFCPNCGTKVVREEEPVQEPEEKAGPAQEAKEPEEKAGPAQEAKEPEEKAEPAQEAKKPEEKAEPAREAKAPETPAPVQEQKGEEKAEKKGGNGILTFLLCLLFFLGSLGICVSLALRMTYSEKKVRSLMDRLEVTEVTIPASSGEELKLVDFLEQASGFDFEKTAGVSKQGVEKLLKKSYVKDMATDLIAGYANYFFTGEKPKAFTRDDVVAFVEEHDNDFFELMKFRFTYRNPETGKREVYTVDIDNAFKDLGTDEITVDWLQEQSGVNLGLLSMVLSVPMLGCLCGICLLLCIIVILLHLKKVSKGVAADGCTLLLTGVVVDIAAIAGLVFLGAKKGSIVAFFLSPLTTNLLIVGSVALVIGLLCFILAKSSGKKAKKQAN